MKNITSFCCIREKERERERERERGGGGAGNDKINLSSSCNILNQPPVETREKLEHVKCTPHCDIGSQESTSQKQAKKKRGLDWA